MVRTGSSYLSQSERGVLFGLGSAASVDEVTIRWPSGVTDRLSEVQTDQRITIPEGRTNDLSE
jgi:hypothetical protein